MEINKKDRQILALLDQNSRTNASELARKLHMSKDGLNYRLKKLQNEKIITRYFAEVDISKVGLIAGKMTLQFQNVDKEKENEIFEFLKNYPKIGWVVFCSGRWDCVFVFYVKDNYEIQEMITTIVEKYGKYILAKEIVSIPEYYVVSRGWLSQNMKRSMSKIGGKVNPLVDELDIKLIKILTKNCRKPIIEIANEVHESSSLIIQRIKNLEKKEIIRNYYIGLNLEKVGKEFCKSFVYLHNYTKMEYETLIKYCLNHPNVTALTNIVGSWEMELEMEVANLDEFHKIMNDIKNQFKHIIRNYEAIVITREYGRDYSTII
jgi:Lrp/AsnC family leucine-responsive transcriptional regulator